MNAIAIERARELFSASDVFRELEGGDIEALAAAARSRGVAPREVLFRKGDPADRLYGVLSGSLRAVALSPEGRELVLRIMGPGELIGEVALLAGGGRTATVVAQESSELLVIERAALFALLEQRPRVARTVLLGLAKRLRALTQEFEDAYFLGLPQRLAKKLLALGAAHGRAERDGQRIGLRLSQEELGTLVGTSRESINKQLRAWQEAGLVRHEAGFVTVLDDKGLRAIADGNA